MEPSRRRLRLIAAGPVLALGAAIGQIVTHGAVLGLLGALAVLIIAGNLIGAVWTLRQIEGRSAAPRAAIVGRHRAYAERVRRSLSLDSVMSTGAPDFRLGVPPERVYVEPRLRSLYPLEGDLFRESDLIGRRGRQRAPSPSLAGPVRASRLC